MLLNHNLTTFQKDMDSLQPYERLEITLKLAKFVLPTLKATELTTDNETKPVKIVFKKIEP